MSETAELREAVDSVLERLRCIPGLSSALVLATAQGILAEIGSWGTRGGPRAVLTSLPEVGDLPSVLRDRLPAGPVTVVELHAGTESLGALLVTSKTPVGTALGPSVQELSDALSTTRRVDRAARALLDRELAVVATELHDGVVQAFVHLRFELDHLARHADVRDVGRLASFAGEALTDVRRLMYGLNPPAGSLAYRLDTHLRELGLIVETSFVARGLVGMVPEAQIFELAAAAVRDLVLAGAARIDVVLEGDVDTLRLTISPDVDVPASVGSGANAATEAGLWVDNGAVHIGFGAVAEAS